MFSTERRISFKIRNFVWGSLNKECIWHYSSQDIFAGVRCYGNPATGSIPVIDWFRPCYSIHTEKKKTHTHTGTGEKTILFPLCPCLCVYVCVRARVFCRINLQSTVSICQKMLPLMCSATKRRGWGRVKGPSGGGFHLASELLRKHLSVKISSARTRRGGGWAGSGAGRWRAHAHTHTHGGEGPGGESGSAIIKNSNSIKRPKHTSAKLRLVVCFFVCLFTLWEAKSRRISASC